MMDDHLRRPEADGRSSDTPSPPDTTASSAPDAPPHNLPLRLTSFVGREREIAEVAALLGARRLVTLVGAPGVGKTRLSLEIAGVVLGTFPDGAWLVELAPLADPSLVSQAVATVLDVREQPGRPLTTTLAEYLRSRSLLLLLDNCEHLVGAIAMLAEALLRTCPSLRILATSREPLTIEGEVTWRVPSLTIPDSAQIRATGADWAASLDRSEAARLFVERAQAVMPSFTLTERSAPVVAQICARLDGIPLALELAAARVRAFSVEQIAVRLDDRFQLLTGGSRTALPRQQTLRGAVDWSYDLLSESEQALLRRLAVFADGFTLDAAEGAGSWVLGSGEGGQTPRTQNPTPDTLVSLVDKSLVQVEETGNDERRYRLLETLRQYGLEKLTEHGELAAVRDRHRDYFVALAEELEPNLTGAGVVAAYRRLERELDNLRAALDWCQAVANTQNHEQRAGSPEQTSGGIDARARLIGATWRFWRSSGHLDEGRRWLEQVFAVPPSAYTLAGRSAQAKARLGAGQIISHLGDYRTAIVHLEHALAFWQREGNDASVVLALQRLGMYHAHLGEYACAARLCDESVTLGRQVGHPFSLAAALITSGIVARFLLQPERAAALHEEALTLCREIGHVVGVANNLRGWGRAMLDLGDAARATALIEQGFSVSRELGDKPGIAESFKDLGRATLLAGDVSRSVETLQFAISLYEQLGDRACLSLCFHGLASAWTVQGRSLEATRLFGATEALREADGLHFEPPFRDTYDRDLATLRESLDEEAFTRAWDEGWAMSLEQAAAYAMAVTAPPEPTQPESTDAGAVLTHRAPMPEAEPEATRLTRREHEVAALVTRGLTNRQIAEQLHLSERTVDTHVRNILGKLELTSRAQIAAWTVEHGLGTSRRT